MDMKIVGTATATTASNFAPFQRAASCDVFAFCGHVRHVVYIKGQHVSLRAILRPLKQERDESNTYYGSILLQMMSMPMGLDEKDETSSWASKYRSKCRITKLLENYS